MASCTPPQCETVVPLGKAIVCDLFAAVPQSYEGVETIPVFNNEEVTLTCPIELGILHQRLMPYELSWDARINNDLPEQVENSIDEGRRLRVYVNDTTSSNQYSCKLRLRRCCVLQEMNCGRCDIMVYDGPIFGFEVFGKGFNNTTYKYGAVEC